MIQKALDAAPTFATVWVGNNDVLSPAIIGQPAGATSQANFVQNYSKMIGQLTAGAPGVKGVLIGVVQVTNAPVLFTSKALLNPQFVASSVGRRRQTDRRGPDDLHADEHVSASASRSSRRSGPGRSHQSSPARKPRPRRSATSSCSTPPNRSR